MTRDNGPQGPDRYKLSNLPIVRHKLAEGASAREDYHHDRHDDAPDERPAELSDDRRYFFEEGRICRLLRCCAPGHIDAEEVAEEGLR